jgi:hypothetical protein
MAFASEEIRLPYTLIEVGTGEQIDEADLMEFRLLYEGQLPSTGNRSRPSEVHEIRRHFHPQLRRLWAGEENLRELAQSAMKEDPRPLNERTTWINPQERYDYGIKAIGALWRNVGFDWVPLVTKELSLRCSIDILFLRPDIEERFLVHRGDLDGQLKTIVDALRMPDSPGEAGGAVPQEDETPFFCLLHNDKLVTELRVVTDRLLLLPNKKEVTPTDCLAVIHVRVNHKTARTFDNYFG